LDLVGFSVTGRANAEGVVVVKDEVLVAIMYA
jgi:hypothetical protein